MTEITPCSSYSRFVSGASNRISASREWENLFLFRENFMSRMWGEKKMFLFYIFIRQRKYDIIFHDIAFYAFSLLVSLHSPLHLVRAKSFISFFNACQI